MDNNISRSSQSMLFSRVAASINGGDERGEAHATTAADDFNRETINHTETNKTSDRTNFTRMIFGTRSHGGVTFPTDILFTLDHRDIWRRNLVWAKTDSAQLRTLLTQRFASNSVFLTLIVSSQIGILFSPAEPSDEVRHALAQHEYHGIEFWAGITLCFSILVSLLGIYSNFSAWGILSVVSDSNVHAIMRSSIGLKTTAMPSRLIMLAINFFFLTIALFLFVIVDFWWALGVTVGGYMALAYITLTYSALARVIVESGAMGEEEVLTTSEEEELSPVSLQSELVTRVKLSRELRDMPLRKKYRSRKYQSSIRDVATQQILRRSYQISQEDEVSALQDEIEAADLGSGGEGTITAQKSIPRKPPIFLQRQSRSFGGSTLTS